MIPSPEHHIACTVQEPAKAEKHQYVGHVKCPCGCDTFEMQHTGATHEWRGKTIPCDAKLDGGFFFRIVAKCANCGTEHLLLDKDFHGWNGFVCREELGDYLRLRPPLVAWPCKACGKAAHKADIMVFSEGKERTIEESDGMLDETNWQEGFGSITIDIRCTACGNTHESWVECETM